MFAFVFVAFIAFCSLDYSHAQSFINRFINIGSQSGANQHDIVQNGQWSMLTPHAWQDRLSHNEYPMSKTTDHKMYITLRSDAPDAVNISIKWNSVGGFGSVGDVGYVAGTRVSWDDADWSATVTLQPGDEHWVQFFQATGDAYADNMAPHVTKTGCTSPRDVVLDGAAKPWFDLHVDDAFMRFNMTKECVYPRLAFGTSTGSRLSVKDILSPVNLGDTPNLQSNPSFSLAITPNRPTRQIVMSMETGGGWTSVQGTTYSFQYGSSDNDVRIDTPVMNGDIGVYLVDSGDYTKVVPLMFRSICSQTAIQNNLNRMLSMNVYAGFSSPYVLNIFNVTCGRPSGTEGNWPQLTIQPAPSQQLVGWENSYVYQNNEVGALWHPDGKLVELGRQQQTITFNLNYQADPRQYSGNIQVNVVTGGSIQGVNGRITRVYNKQTNVDIARNTTYSFPNSGQLALAMDTMCLAEGTMVVDVLLSEVRSQGLVGQYMPIEYRFTWQCIMPKFTLSAPNTPDLATNGTGNEGTYGNRVVQKTVTGTGTVTAITTRLNSDMLTDVIYLTLQEPTVSNYKYLFSWQFIPTDTHNINDATVQLQGREISDAAGARDFEFPFQINQQGDRIQLSVDRFTCTKRGEVRLVTWLRFGFFTRVDLIWIRQCTDVPDQWNDDSSSLSDGAIFGIIVAVLIAVGCCGGIAYNSIKLGKSGLSVIPGVDTFNAWNDGVQGPKRYSTDISKNSKSKVADVEIHSLGYGSYQQSDDGYVDEIDTL